jgi:hypothetical protein
MKFSIRFTRKKRPMQFSMRLTMSDVSRDRRLDRELIRDLHRRTGSAETEDVLEPFLGGEPRRSTSLPADKVYDKFSPAVWRKSLVASQ